MDSLDESFLLQEEDETDFCNEFDSDTSMMIDEECFDAEDVAVASSSCNSKVDAFQAFPAILGTSTPASVEFITTDRLVRLVHEVIDEHSRQTGLPHLDIFRTFGSTSWKDLGCGLPPVVAIATPLQPAIRLESTCIVCLESIEPIKITPLSCIHCVCVDCHRDYIMSHLRYGALPTAPDHHHGSTNPYSIMCPAGSECATPICPVAFDLLVLNDPQMFSLYKRFFLNHWTATSLCKRYKSCPNKTCDLFVGLTSPELVDRQTLTIVCECGQRWCFSCADLNIGSHFPFSCSQVELMSKYGAHLYYAQRRIGGLKNDQHVLAKHELIDCSIQMIEHFGKTKQVFNSSLIAALKRAEEVGLKPTSGDNKDVPLPFLLDSSPSNKPCPSCLGMVACPTSAIANTTAAKTNDVVVCGECGFQFCWTCEVSLVGLGKDCTHKCNVTAVKSHIGHIIDADWLKVCPRSTCGAIIQKVTGCTHMTCAACYIHFCWSCKGNPHTGACDSGKVAQARADDVSAVQNFFTQPLPSHLANRSSLINGRCGTIMSKLGKYFTFEMRENMPMLKRQLLFVEDFLFWSSLYLQVVRHWDEQMNMTAFSFGMAKDTIRTCIEKFDKLTSFLILEGVHIGVDLPTTFVPDDTNKKYSTTTADVLGKSAEEAETSKHIGAELADLSVRMNKAMVILVDSFLQLIQ